jgi:hypothetical protein
MSYQLLSRCMGCWQVDEDSGENATITVDLNSLFADLKFTTAEEVTLSAGQPLSKVWCGPFSILLVETLCFCLLHWKLCWNKSH